MALEQGIESEETKKTMNENIEKIQKSLESAKESAKEMESKINKANTVNVISAVMLCIVILSQGLVAGVLTGYIYKLPSNTADSQKGTKVYTGCKCVTITPGLHSGVTVTLLLYFGCLNLKN